MMPLTIFKGGRTMDGRKALAPGTILKLSTRTGHTEYMVRREIGRGGSCIVYDASTADNLGNDKLVRIKECYPHALRLKRGDDGSLRAEEKDSAAFEAAKSRIIGAYQKNHELFMTAALTNTVANTSNLYEENGTVYIVSTWMNGQTFADVQTETLHDCIALVLSTARALKSIHEAGFLYLDLKPENILTIKGSLDLVQLFDFDSMISMADLEHAVRENDPTLLRTSYTRGYAPLEQQTGKLRQIGRHSDLYSLGAVLFEALWHRTPNAFDCEENAVYDYSSIAYSQADYQDALFRELTVFFHKTLASYCGDRYQDADGAISQLQKILALADATRAWVRSTPLQPVPVFYGRKKELPGLADFLDENRGHICSLYGMGGIGKSTLVKRCIAESPDAWDAVLWLYDQGDLNGLIADDTQVQINTVSRTRGETSEEYCARKLQALGRLAESQHILMVLDNFDASHINQVRKLSTVGATILLISRERLPEGLYPAFRVGELDEAGLKAMFGHYSHCDLSEPDNLEHFTRIITAIEGHTLLTELIARQIAGSYLDLETAGEMVAGLGLSELPEDKIDYIHDQTAYHGTLLKILDRLVEADQFSEQDRCCMKLLSLFNAPGIKASLFRQLTESKDVELVNGLEAAGWLKKEGSLLYLHPMMQEYIRTWPWDQEMVRCADGMAMKMYRMILPEGKRHDTSKQFPDNPDAFYGLLRLAEQVITHYDVVTEASQRLLYRWVMDAPVDQDTEALFRMLDLLENPAGLDADSILRLYENAAYYRARLYIPDDAIEILHDMKKYLVRHPSAYYLSAYHRAMAVILHNANRDWKKCVSHEDKAIAAARLSKHPEAKKQLAACLLDKATTLMSERIDQKQVRKLVHEAGTIVPECTGPLDYERYQFACNAAMCYAMDGNEEQAMQQMEAADAIAYASPDSDLAIAEHLIEEKATLLIELKQFEEAEDAVMQAIRLCGRHPEAIRYRETIFDAYIFLGRIYGMAGQFIKAEEAFEEAEKRVEDSPFVWKLPLCPEEIRTGAKEERKRHSIT